MGLPAPPVGMHLQEAAMKQHADGIECATCDNYLWVTDGGPDLDTPCPDCNEGLQRGGPEYDRHEAVAADTALPPDRAKTTH